MHRILAAGLCVLLTASPAAALAPPPEPPAGPPAFSDDGDRETLLAAIARTRAWLAATPRKTVLVATRPIATETLRTGLAAFEALVQTRWGEPGFADAVRDGFEWVPMPGKDGQGAVHVTGYHQPLLEAREAADATFKFPLYAPPTDALTIDLGAFRASLGGQTALARLKANRVVPYFTRREIDEGQALAGKGLEIAWVADARARAGLMLQGSGQLRFADGRVACVNYAGQNGHPFLPGEANQSYVFFKLAPEGPFGSDGIALTAGRAIATDKRLFGTGTLAWLSYPRARFDAQGAAVGWEPGGRFVLDQDTGGAITGPGRLDLYTGGGEAAARQATSLYGPARVWFLVPKAPTPVEIPAQPAGK